MCACVYVKLQCGLMGHKETATSEAKRKRGRVRRTKRRVKSRAYTYPCSDEHILSMSVFMAVTLMANRKEEARTHIGECKKKPLPLMMMMTLYCYIQWCGAAAVASLLLTIKRIDSNTCAKWINTECDLHTVAAAIVSVSVSVPLIRSFLFRCVCVCVFLFFLCFHCSFVFF